MSRKKIITISIFTSIWIIVVFGDALGIATQECIKTNCIKLADSSMPTNGHSSNQELEDEAYSYEGEDPDSFNNESEEELTYEEEETDVVQEKQSGLKKEDTTEGKKKWWQFWK